MRSGMISVSGSYTQSLAMDSLSSRRVTRVVPVAPAVAEAAFVSGALADTSSSPGVVGGRLVAAPPAEELPLAISRCVPVTSSATVSSRSSPTSSQPSSTPFGTRAPSSTCSPSSSQPSSTSSCSWDRVGDVVGCNAAGGCPGLSFERKLRFFSKCEGEDASPWC